MAHDVTVGDPGWFVVVNPASGGGAARRLLAIGGDGTFHELVNGLHAQERVPPAEVTAAVAPLGSGNDWARAHGMPRDPARLADAMASAPPRRVDLGRATCEGDAQARIVTFHNAAGAGLDAAVVGATSPRGPRAPAYALALLRALRRFRAPHFTIATDGGGAGGRCLTAIAAIGPDCGGGMRLAPGARPDDGAFDLVTVAELPLLRALALAPGLWSGRAAAHPAFGRITCTAARIESEPPCDVEADGQLVGRTPLEVRILPGALRTLDCRAPASG